MNTIIYTTPLFMLQKGKLIIIYYLSFIIVKMKLHKSIILK